MWDCVCIVDKWQGPWTAAEANAVLQKFDADM